MAELMLEYGSDVDLDDIMFPDLDQMLFPNGLPPHYASTEIQTNLKEDLEIEVIAPPVDARMLRSNSAILVEQTTELQLRVSQRIRKPKKHFG